jgi:hypothetical protein
MYLAYETDLGLPAFLRPAEDATAFAATAFAATAFAATAFAHGNDKF